MYYIFLEGSVQKNMTSASCDDRLLDLLLQLLIKIEKSLIRTLCRIIQCSTLDLWLAVRDLSITTPGHKHIPGVDAFLSGDDGIGDVLTEYVQQQCAGFLQKFPSEEAYMEASQKKSSTSVQSRQASESSDGGFVLITHDDAKSYQGPKGPIRRK